ncbi:MAG: J domain-containing protein [Chloroflexota bacterium]|nr:J domain-containing protein [Chloroflexota bacterium]
MGDPPDPYKTLQVDPEADIEVIQAAYRRLAQKYHPDLAADPAAKARMVAINNAWGVLRDPAARAALDDARAAAVRRAEAARTSTPGSGAPSAGSGPAGPASAEADGPSSNWTSGRFSTGGGYDPRTMRAKEGFGAAGPPPGNPSGSVMNFGRFAGWSLGEIARRDIEYVEWLERMPIGRPYREEIDVLLRAAGRRRATAPDSGPRRGLFRRR